MKTTSKPDPKHIPANPPPHVLVAEDEQYIAKAIAHKLSMHGYRVTVVDNGVEATDHLLYGDVVDLAILDIMMPLMDGLDVLRRIRKFGCETPVVVVSGKDDPVDRIRGLEAGADDYLGKPFNTHELFTRVETVRRRVAHNHGYPRRIQVGDTTIDFESYTAIRGNAAIHLTPMQWRMLKHMAFREGRAVSRADFKVHVLKIPPEIETRTIDRHAFALRQKLDKNPRKPRHIIAVTGIGYRLQDFEVLT